MSTRERLRTAAWLLVTLSLFGCRRQLPSITFTSIPPVSFGGPDVLQTIAGKVKGARPDERIVLYTKAGTWWVQPLAGQPFTSIRNGAWSSDTHLGTDYAALLVASNYAPESTIDALPKVGAGVVATASTHGSPASSRLDQLYGKTVSFSGYEWEARSLGSTRGGTYHSYSTGNVTIDERGLMHLRVTGSPGKRACSEVSLNRTLGYGSYAFTIKDVAHLDPAAALSVFTWSDSPKNQNHGEMDANFSRWGDPKSKNAEFALQPYYVPLNVSRYAVPSGPFVVTFRWEPDSIVFETRLGEHGTPRDRLIATHTFRSAIPLLSGETAHINVCDFPYARVPLQNDGEVVIEHFQFLP